MSVGVTMREELWAAAVGVSMREAVRAAAVGVSMRAAAVGVVALAGPMARS